MEIYLPTISFNPLQKGNKVSLIIFPTFVPVNIFRNKVHTIRTKSSSKLKY